MKTLIFQDFFKVQAGYTGIFASKMWEPSHVSCLTSFKSGKGQVSGDTDRKSERGTGGRVKRHHMPAEGPASWG